MALKGEKFLNKSASAPNQSMLVASTIFAYFFWKNWTPLARIFHTFAPKCITAFEEMVFGSLHELLLDV